VASETVPWWDQEWKIRSEWMSWDQVRELRDMGFEIGSHTMNHIDLGVVKGEEARAEIVGAKKRLQEELGITVDLFSYPFGRRHQMCEENLELVRQAGHTCCVSAFGGAVAKTSDPFRLLRAPVSPWYISPYQFGFEALFFRAD